MKILMVIFLGLILYSCINEPINNSKFDGPTKAIVGPDNNLYVSDGYYNSRIAVFTQSGEFLRFWGSKGYDKNQFQNPHGIAFSIDDNLLVADRDNGRIQTFTQTGAYVSEWHSQTLGIPWDIAVADDGTIFSVDGGDQDDANPRGGIVKLSSNGDVICRFSSFGTAVGQLNWGHSIAASYNGEMVFVVDLNNSRVQKFESSSENMDDYEVVPNWPNIQNDQKFEPLGITYSDGMVFITQKEKHAPIFQIDAESGNLIKEIGNGIFEYAHGISIDKNQTIWVTDKDADKVFHLTMDGVILLTIEGNN